MKKYKVAVVYQMYGWVTVEAEDADEARLAAAGAPLPEEASYVEGSLEIDELEPEEIE